MYIFSYTHISFTISDNKNTFVSKVIYLYKYTCFFLKSSRTSFSKSHVFKAFPRPKSPAKICRLRGEAWLKLQRNNPTEHRRGLDSNHRWCSTSHRLETSHTQSQLQSSPLRLTTCVSGTYPEKNGLYKSGLGHFFVPGIRFLFIKSNRSWIYPMQ